jgi:transposase
VSDEKKQQEVHYWVGIDWAHAEHQACVLEANGTVRYERVVKHDGAALSEFASFLMTLAEGHPERVAVAIERPDGAVVETLLERGFLVHSINPKQLDRFRDRHTVSGAKDDRRDAYVLADSLRTDRHLYRLVSRYAPETIALREVTRLEQELASQFVQATNRLREQLSRYYPQALQLEAVDEPWFWQLLEMAPAPKEAAKLRPARVVAVLKKHQIRRFKATDVVKILQATPVIVAPGVVDAACMHIGSLLRQLRVLHAEQKRCSQLIRDCIAKLCEPTTTTESSEGQKCEHRDAEIILSLPGVGITVAAAMLAEAARPLANRDYESLRLMSGVAPVTLQTGKQKQRGSRKKKRKAPPPKILMRQACNHRLRNAIFYMSRTASQCDPHWNKLYQDAMDRGVEYGCALRIVGDRMLKTLVAMLRNRAMYNPARFAAPVPIQATG